MYPSFERHRYAMSLKDEAGELDTAMITHEQNALLTQTGPGTPMGELSRR